MDKTAEVLPQRTSPGPISSHKKRHPAGRGLTLRCPAAASAGSKKPRCPECGSEQSRASVRISAEWECPLCGSRGPSIAFDEHHVSYDPEITIFICANCHAQISRAKLSMEQQLQLQWANEQLRLVVLAYQKRIAKLKAQVCELEKLKRGLLEPIKEYVVEKADSEEKNVSLIQQGFEPVVPGLYRKRVKIPWRLL